MKKKFLKLLLVLTSSVMAVSAVLSLSACGKKDDSVELNFLEENIIDDKYDNYYEIFVYSYCDSDGDGYGDLKGVTSKLDYIRDMGYTGIWLMPIMPSASYHGYDVTDYYNINEKYGTLDDYDELLEEAHERGIKVIIDLVVNHTSSKHPWFTKALSGSSQYKDYYNFSNVQLSGYNYANGKWYESQFDSSMPDLNLQNDAVRNEIRDIMKFWLDRDTDGFRLDGVLYYCTQSTDTYEFCTWLNDTAAAINAENNKPSPYIVGELWSSSGVIMEGYKTGIDSFFYFGTNSNIAGAINISSASELWVRIRQVENAAGDYIPAPFLSNHDNGVGRFAGVAGQEVDKIKFGYGLLSMFKGNTFTYYGDEIGMINNNTNSDPDLRVGILWDDNKTGMPQLPPGTQQEPTYLFGSVESQLKDNNSIINYYKLCNNTRNAFPELMRGTTTRVSYSDDEILILNRTYNGNTVTIVINLAESNKTVKDIEGKLAQSICVTGRINASGSSLTMPKYSIAILTHN